MNRIEANAETLMKQAPMTASFYFQKAIEDIDNVFGKGFAKANPQLIGDYMKTSALDFLSASITSGLQDISEPLYRLQDISSALENVSNAIESLED